MSSVTFTLNPVLKPDEDLGFRELFVPIFPVSAQLSKYDPAEAVQILSRLWAYPATSNDVYRLMRGQPADIIAYRKDDLSARLYGFDLAVTQKIFPEHATVGKYLHGADVVFYNAVNFMPQLQVCHCFVSTDPISVNEVEACLSKDHETGVFVVYQLCAYKWPNWKEETWKPFECEVRSHLGLTF